MALFLQKITNYFVFLVLLSMVSVSHATVLLPEFTAYEEQYIHVLDKASHIILNSSPKRISNAIVIEAQREVEGVRENRLISVPQRFNIKDIFEFYSTELVAQSENVFQCSKRSCGSSNYWANDFFQERRLYGRDSEQFFISGKLKSSSSDVWYMIYVVQNGLKQNLVYMTTITESGEGRGFQSGMLYLHPLPQRVLDDLKAAVGKSGATNLWLAAYSDRDKLTNIDGTLESLAGDTENKKQILMAALGDDSDRIRTVVVGPFHSESYSADNGRWYRLYLTE